MKRYPIREAARLRDRVEALLLEHPFSPPTPKEMVASSPGLAAEDLTEILQHLAFDGRAVCVATDLCHHAKALEDLAARLRVFFPSKADLTVGEFKQLFGVSRKHAVPLLEHLDRAGLTVRRGDVRVAGGGLSGR